MIVSMVEDGDRKVYVNVGLTVEAREALHRVAAIYSGQLERNVTLSEAALLTELIVRRHRSLVLSVRRREGENT